MGLGRCVHGNTINKASPLHRTMIKYYNNKTTVPTSRKITNITSYTHIGRTLGVGSLFQNTFATGFGNMRGLSLSLTLSCDPRRSKSCASAAAAGWPGPTAPDRQESEDAVLEYINICEMVEGKFKA